MALSGAMVSEEVAMKKAVAYISRWAPLRHQPLLLARVETFVPEAASADN